MIYSAPEELVSMVIFNSSTQVTADDEFHIALFMKVAEILDRFHALQQVSTKSHNDIVMSMCIYLCLSTRQFQFANDKRFRDEN